jgi:hypothetical protein
MHNNFLGATARHRPEQDVCACCLPNPQAITSCCAGAAWSWHGFKLIQSKGLVLLPFFAIFYTLYLLVHDLGMKTLQARAPLTTQQATTSTAMANQNGYPCAELCRWETMGGPCCNSPSWRLPTSTKQQLHSGRQPTQPPRRYPPSSLPRRLCPNTTLCRCITRL